MSVRITLLRLKMSMYTTIALIISVSTLLLTAIFYALVPDVDIGALLYGSLVFIVVIHLIQWLLGPKIIEAMYRAKPLPPDLSWLNDLVSNIAAKSGLRKAPKVMITNIDVPNAFAYGNVFTGYKVAVTRGLLDNLPRDEIEAVVAHEVGHIKHRDVEVMMIISILPALIYWLGQVLYRYGFISSLAGNRRERNTSPLMMALLGMGLIAISFIFNLFILHVSRLREYYADSHAATVVNGGALKLQRALARIIVTSEGARRIRPSSSTSISKFKALLISDPELRLGGRRFYDIDEVVEYIKSVRSLTPLEILSTHPDPAKRLRFLDRFK